MYTVHYAPPLVGAGVGMVGIRMHARVYRASPLLIDNNNNRNSAMERHQHQFNPEPELE